MPVAPLHVEEAITLYEKLKRDAEEQTFRPDQAQNLRNVRQNFSDVFVEKN